MLRTAISVVPQKIYKANIEHRSSDTCMASEHVGGLGFRVGQQSLPMPIVHVTVM